MIPDYPQTSDPVVGTNDTLLENTWDVVNIGIQAALQIEHDADGKHTMMVYEDDGEIVGGVCLYEIGTYTGNGVDDRVISLSNAGIRVLFVKVWTNTTALSPAWRSSLMAEDKSKYIASYISNSIQSCGVGTFTVGTHNTVNTNGVTYYYAAYGVADYDNLPSNGSSFTPEWIEHGESIALDANSDGAPSRPSKQVLTKFRVGHNDDGTHKTAMPYKIEVGAYTGDGTNLRYVNLTDSAMVIKIVLVWGATTLTPIVRVASSSNSFGTKALGAAVYVNYISDLQPGKFRCHNGSEPLCHNTNGVQYYYVVWGE